MVVTGTRDFFVDVVEPSIAELWNPPLQLPLPMILQMEETRRQFVMLKPRCQRQAPTRYKPRVFSESTYESQTFTAENVAQTCFHMSPPGRIISDPIWYNGYSFVLWLDMAREDKKLRLQIKPSKHCGLQLLDISGSARYLAISIKVMASITSGSHDSAGLQKDINFFSTSVAMQIPFSRSVKPTSTSSLYFRPDGSMTIEVTFFPPDHPLPLHYE